MTYKSLLTATCTVQAEMYTTNAIGESIRTFDDPVSVKCRFDPQGQGTRDDIELGKIIQDNRYVLYVLPDTDITTAHKVTLAGVDYKVDRVRNYEDGIGKLHHKECDLQEIV